MSWCNAAITGTRSRLWPARVASHLCPNEPYRDHMSVPIRYCCPCCATIVLRYRPVSLADKSAPFLPTRGVDLRRHQRRIRRGRWRSCRQWGRRDRRRWLWRAVLPEHRPIRRRAGGRPGAGFRVDRTRWGATMGSSLAERAPAGVMPSADDRRACGCGDESVEPAEPTARPDDSGRIAHILEIFDQP